MKNITTHYDIVSYIVLCIVLHVRKHTTTENGRIAKTRCVDPRIEQGSFFF
jgi:hypothetical protein